MTIFPAILVQQASAILETLKAQRKTLATAESCTGGLLAAVFTEIAGSSAVFTHGYVSYANAAKTAMLGVDAADITEYGAVSEQVARQMASGARTMSGAAVAIATTGIAGPTGGSVEKPVGLVFMAVATEKGVSVEKHFFTGNRSEIRLAAVARGVEMLAAALYSHSKTKLPAGENDRNRANMYT